MHENKNDAQGSLTNSEMIKNHNFFSSQIFFENGEMMKNVINFSDFLPRTLPPFPLTHHLWRRREQGSSSKSASSWLGNNCSLEWYRSNGWLHYLVNLSLRTCAKEARFWSRSLIRCEASLRKCENSKILRLINLMIRQLCRWACWTWQRVPPSTWCQTPS